MKWALLLLMMSPTGLAHQATNGQQIAFGGVRFVELEIRGINHDNLPVVWNSRKEFARGDTLAYLPDWWWKGQVTFIAKLKGGGQFECTVGPLKSGALIVLVIAQNSGCLGDSNNSLPPARLIERWLRGRLVQRKLDGVVRLIQTVDDGWLCINALIRRQDVQEECAGVPLEVLKSLG